MGWKADFFIKQLPQGRHILNKAPFHEIYLSHGENNKGNEEGDVGSLNKERMI